MGGKARELNARLFIEGRSIPFTGATLQFTAGQPSTATIQIPPLKEIKKVLPRTSVQLFVKDFSFPGTSKPWVLAFDGEIYGYSMGKSSNSRNFSLYAMDVSSYWDNAKQFYMNIRSSFGDTNSIYASNQAVAQAKKENYQVIQTFAGTKAYLTQIITAKLSRPNTTLMDAIIDVLKNVENVNPFFRYGNAHFRINDRLVMKNSGNMKALFDFSNKEGLWEAIAGGGNGGVRTIRQIVNQLMGMVFHDFISAPFPSKVNNGVASGMGPKKNKTVGSFLFKPDSYIAPPPKCNVLFPDQYGNFSYSRNFFHEVTRLKFQPALTSAQIQSGLNVPMQPTYYSPNGFGKFRTKAANDSVGSQFNETQEGEQYGDKAASDDVTSTVLLDYHFLSYEEVLKGIFSDMGNMIPSAQAFAQVGKFNQNGAYYQKATDYMFYQKRFASRMSMASGPLNLAPVPGFNMLLLDDSEAEQHVLGVLQSVTHQISAEGGGMTSYQLAYAREVEEVDFWDDDAYEPPVPPWYDSAVFGKRRPVKKDDYKGLPTGQQSRVKVLKNLNGYEGTKLRDYYLGLLGDTDANSHLGAEPIVNDNFPNVVAGTLSLLNAYRSAKSKGDEKEFIDIQTRRDYVQLGEYFQFMGATLKAGQENIDTNQSADIVFSGEVFDGGFVDKAKSSSRDLKFKSLFSTAVKKRRKPVDLYRKRLLNERGFRG